MSNKSGGALMTPIEELQEIEQLLKETDDNAARAVGTEGSPENIAYRRGFLEGRAFEITREMDEHPEWWDRVCFCHSCATC